MALSDFREWWWNRTGVYFASSSGDLPSTDAGSTFNPGDIVINIAPTLSGPWGWMCISGGTSPTWASMGFTGGSTGRAVRSVSAATVTATTADRFIVATTVTTAITIPAGTAWPSGNELTISNDTSGSITVTPAAGTIDNTSASTITTFATKTYVGYGVANWSSGV